MTSRNNCIPTCHEYLAKVTRCSFSSKPEVERLARETRRTHAPKCDSGTPYLKKDIWKPYTSECLTLQCEGSNTHDRHVVCLTVSLVRANHGTVQRLCTCCSAIIMISSYTPHKFVCYAPQQRGEAMLSVGT